ncbi:HNH endonuclease [Altererythrobacter sp. SALINAS58]|nr:HNH endonuclease [Alteripontixanthobacter muriae]
MGKSGDQSIGFMQNKTLAESSVNGVAVHLFEVHKPSVYSYVGPVELASEPYQDAQNGEDGTSRKVWIFPVTPKTGSTKPLSLEALRIEAEAQAKRAKALSDAALKAKAKQSGSTRVGVRPAITQQYQRNPWVAEYAKRRAAGHCQLCTKPAPFSTKAGEPYLEVHHVQWLSQGGADTIENTVALCPNCHRMMHVVGSADHAEKLSAAAAP